MAIDFIVIQGYVKRGENKCMTNSPSSPLAFSFVSLKKQKNEVAKDEGCGMK
jgi:hypothetical protein